eukprot:TRINITY_DN1405_c0_g1_i1.p1 TRINITY_DN1405_c0_g1~~TRINITY_DN1405_c0_g1_i1.p1  ORF type:complete len:350 (+),score=57.71 TRINITY_DN1405_c0_g1_i1:53-1102(+)
MPLRAGTLRSFGAWKYELVDLASGACSYINTETGEVCDRAPVEVQEILQKESRQALYEPTSNRFVELPRDQSAALCICCQGTGHSSYGTCPLCDGIGSFDDASRIERVSLWDPDDDSAFLLRNFLSPAECDDIIAQAEAFGFQPTNESHRIRVTDRAIVMGEDLGQLLFDRASPYLGEITVPAYSRPPRGVRDDIFAGSWQPQGLNPCFRVCRYSPGGFFFPHHDGGFDKGDRHRSIKTFMIYLNDDFVGGPTNFYSEKQRHYRRPSPENLIRSLRVEKGSCLVFNHCICHDGGELLAGSKYILRTEVMYEKESAFLGHDGEQSDSDFETDADSECSEQASLDEAPKKD